MFRVLLVDDDPSEEAVVKRALNFLTRGAFELEYVGWCSEAMDRLNLRMFDLVLLDNRLTRAITAEFTVPMLKSVKYPAPIAVASSDTSPLYLSDPSILGVEYVLDKMDLIPFLEKRIKSVQAHQHSLN